MQGLLRRATPLILLGLAFLVWFEAFLPGRDWFAREFGDDFVLRFALGMVCVYAAMLTVDRARLEHAFKQLVEAFREFHRGGAAGGRLDPRKQLEAVELLIGALASSDASVRKSSAEHLARITGEDHGEDEAAWRRWLAAQRAAAGGDGAGGSA